MTAHPETDWHGWNYEHNEWWHYSAPPESKPLERCNCTGDAKIARSILSAIYEDDEETDPSNCTEYWKETR